MRASLSHKIKVGRLNNLGKKEKEKCQNVEGKVLKRKKINCRKIVSLIGPSTTVNHQ